ncbi:MAG: holo-ACP synthase [Fibrobacterota bacterium]
MIIGLGNDIVSVERISRLLQKQYSRRFVARVFTEHEREYSFRQADPAYRLAARWAVKEAFYKALPESLQGLARWHSVELRRDGKKPVLNVVDGAFRSSLEDAGVMHIHHSVSHERRYAAAVVILAGDR